MYAWVALGRHASKVHNLPNKAWWRKRRGERGLWDSRRDSNYKFLTLERWLSRRALLCYVISTYIYRIPRFEAKIAWNSRYISTYIGGKQKRLGTLKISNRWWGKKKKQWQKNGKIVFFYIQISSAKAPWILHSQPSRKRTLPYHGYSQQKYNEWETSNFHRHRCKYILVLLCIRHRSGHLVRRVGIHTATPYTISALRYYPPCRGLQNPIEFQGKSFL